MGLANDEDKGGIMAEESKTVEVDVEGEKFSVKLVSRDGKVFAESQVPGFGGIRVPDFGGGEARAIKEVRARLAVLARDAKAPKLPGAE